MPNIKRSDLEKFAFVDWEPGTPWDISRLPFDRRLGDSIIGGLLIEVLRGNVTEKAACLTAETRLIALSDFVLAFERDGKKPRFLREHEGSAFLDWENKALKTTTEDTVGLVGEQKHPLSSMTIQQAYHTNPGFFGELLRRDPSMIPKAFDSSSVLRTTREGFVYAKTGSKLRKSKDPIDMINTILDHSNSNATTSGKEERKSLLSWVQPNPFEKPDVVQTDNSKAVCTPLHGIFRAAAGTKVTPTNAASIPASIPASSPVPFSVKLIEELNSVQAKVRHTAKELESARTELANLQAKYENAVESEAKTVMDNITFLNKQVLQATDHAIESIFRLRGAEHDALTLQLIKIAFRMMHRVLVRNEGTEQALQDLIAFHQKTIGEGTGQDPL